MSVEVYVCYDSAYVIAVGRDISQAGINIGNNLLVKIHLRKCSVIRIRCVLSLYQEYDAREIFMLCLWVSFLIY